MDTIFLVLLVGAPIIVVGIVLYHWRQRAPNNPADQPGSRPGKTLLSIFLLVLGVLLLVVSAFVVFLRSDGIVKALPGLAIAAVFFALGRTLDYLDEIVERQRRIETLLERKGDKT
jgi:hypothetical protein